MKIRRAVGTILMIALLCGTGTVALAQKGYGGILEKDLVFICKGPSSGTYGTKGSLKVGTKLFYSKKVYEGRAPEGYKTAYRLVMTEYGKTGYVYRGFIDGETDSADSTQVYYCTGSGVKLRKKANADSETILLLKKKQHFILRKKGEEYSSIELLDGTRGYIATRYIKQAEW